MRQIQCKQVLSLRIENNLLPKSQILLLACQLVLIVIDALDINGSWMKTDPCILNFPLFLTYCAKKVKNFIRQDEETKLKKKVLAIMLQPVTLLAVRKLYVSDPTAVKSRCPLSNAIFCLICTPFSWVEDGVNCPSFIYSDLLLT